jgi:hypothetical protein
LQLVPKNPFAGDHLTPGGRDTRLQVSLPIRASNSACIAVRQFGSVRASRTERGSGDTGATWRLRRSTG